MDDVEKRESRTRRVLRLLLNGTPGRDALYLGDNIDDALSAKRSARPISGRPAAMGSEGAPGAREEGFANWGSA